MGQKVNPHGLRVGIIKDWDSRWYAEGDFADLLVEDYNIRKFLKKNLYSAGISKVEVERASDRVKVIVFAQKPGIVIGRGGEAIEKTRKTLQKMTGKKILLDIKEIKRPDKDAQLVAENIAQQLEGRVSFRRAMKSCMGRTMKAGALGIKASCGGRLGGAVWAVLISHVQRPIPREPFRCRHCARTSTMALRKQTQPTARLASRSGSTRVRSFPQRTIIKQKGVIADVNAQESEIS